MDDGLVRAAASERSREGLLHAEESARSARRRELRSTAARNSHSAQGNQRWIAPVRAEHCRRYRPAARFPEPIDTSASHLGFRCIVRVKPESVAQRDRMQDTFPPGARAAAVVIE